MLVCEVFPDMAPLGTSRFVASDTPVVLHMKRFAIPFHLSSGISVFLPDSTFTGVFFQANQTLSSSRHSGHSLVLMEGMNELGGKRRRVDPLSQDASEKFSVCGKLVARTAISMQNIFFQLFFMSNSSLFTAAQ